MWKLRLLPVLIVGLAFSDQRALAQNGKPHNVQNLEGRYERTGVVDGAIEAQFKGLGPVLPGPVFIDGLLPFPPTKWTGQDKEFVVQPLGPSNYAFILPKENKRCMLVNMGNVAELNDGILLLRRPGIIAGEGNIPVDADAEVRFTKEIRDGAEWLVIETRIKWTKRSLFRSKQVEYRSLVRFREIASLP